MGNIDVTISCKNVANYLKCLVNQRCTDGFKWYEDANEKQGMSLFDINMAIEILDSKDDETVTIIDQGGADHGKNT